jgi:hypothetical protein
MTTYTYNERTASQSPSGGKMGLDKGLSQRIFNIAVSGPADLYAIGREVLGYTYYPVSGDGRLTRIPPLADPVWTCYFAETIDKIT